MTTMQYATTRKQPVTDWQIMGFWWPLIKPIIWAVSLEGRLIDWRNRHLNGGE